MLQTGIIEIVEPEVRPLRVEPEVRPLRVEPEARQLGVEPEVRQLRVEPEVRPLRVELEVRQLGVEPEVQRLREEPEVRQLGVEPEVRQLMIGSLTAGRLIAQRVVKQLINSTVLLQKRSPAHPRPRASGRPPPRPGRGSVYPSSKEQGVLGPPRTRRVGRFDHSCAATSQNQRMS